MGKVLAFLEVMIGHGTCTHTHGVKANGGAQNQPNINSPQFGPCYQSSF